MKNLLFVTLISALLVACNTGTRLKNHWQAEGFSKKQLDKVLVVAVTSNLSNRMIFEDSFAQGLKKDGIIAYASYQALGTDNPTRESVVDYVKKHDIKYVLATKVDNIKVNTDYVPESVTTYVTGGYYPGHYYPTYGSYWGGDTYTMVNEAYTEVQTILMLVTSIYDAKTEAQVWTGYSESFEVNAIGALGDKLAQETLHHISR